MNDDKNEWLEWGKVIKRDSNLSRLFNPVYLRLKKYFYYSLFVFKTPNDIKIYRNENKTYLHRYITQS